VEYIGAGLTLCNVLSGATLKPLEEYSGDANWLHWLPDGTLAVAAFTGLTTTILAVRPGSPLTVLNPCDGCVIGAAPLMFSTDRSGQWLATTGETASMPREVFTGAVNGQLQRRTQVHAHVAALDHGEVRRLTWTCEGSSVEGVLYLPIGYTPGQRVPLIVQVHGGPASHYSDNFRGLPLTWAPLLAANGYAVLLPNPRGGGGRGRAFMRANYRDWGGCDYRDIMAGVDHVIALGVADPDRMGVCGWSYGGYMSSWVIGHTRRFKAAVIGAAVTDLYSFQGNTDIARGFIPGLYAGAHPYREPAFWHERSPIEHIADATTPSLILGGEADARVPIGQSWELYRALRSLGVETVFVRYPREEHGFHERAHQIDVQRRVLGWFERFLG
jgi:dipeptidyl aminopeptidase/acylaminoacyl peptidase